MDPSQVNIPLFKEDFRSLVSELSLECQKADNQDILIANINQAKEKLLQTGEDPAKAAEDLM